jgi:farnesyl-diphosphate farnesyltransferase
VLTLRFLPHEVREPIALAYLLARLSDTEADGAVSEAENELLSRKPEILELLENSPDRKVIQNVWTTIQEGQAFDRERFSDSQSPPLSAEELDRYTYLVAGCVGEFWTEICDQKIPRFSKRPIDEMRTLGVEYGKALQLVNILRDRTKDSKLGRKYLSPESFLPTLNLARTRLESANAYIKAIRPRRLRMATALPCLLASPTLDLIEAQPGAPNVKISKIQLWQGVLRALIT